MRKIILTFFLIVFVKNCSLTSKTAFAQTTQCNPQNNCDCTTQVPRKCDDYLHPETCCPYPQCYEVYGAGSGASFGFHLRCYQSTTGSPTSGLGCGQQCSGINDKRCPPQCPCFYNGKIFICSHQSLLYPTAYPTIDIHGPCPTDKITTALGCVPTGNFSDFVGWLLKRLIGISGGIAFLLVIFGGFKILTSAGNPKGIQAGSEIISSALIGLLFIIFSIFLLELIGVKILGIPGL